jgi:hypothetical protein
MLRAILQAALASECLAYDRRAVFLIAATGIMKLPVDALDRNPPGMIDLDRVRQLKQFSLGGFGRRERAILFEFHFPCFRRADVILESRDDPIVRSTSAATRCAIACSHSGHSSDLISKPGLPGVIRASVILA